MLTNNLSAQTLTLKRNISTALQETSGLLYLNGKLITHTDSGGEPALYEMDTTTGIQTRKVLIQNATNIDWEDITMDSDFIYIGDFGNNQGNRTNLRIYKIALQDYLNMDTVLADTIKFNYSDQTNFSSSSFSTNYDAEALISLGDSLYIFTKNWGDGKSNIYPVSKTPGQYALIRTDSLNPQGYITGAVCDSANKQILLIGYTINSAFFMKINNWSSSFSGGQILRQVIQPNSSIQIEGIAQIDSFHYFISSERFQTTVSQLHVLDCRFPTKVTTLKNNPISIYPNPCRDYINIDTKEKTTSTIFSLGGVRIKSSCDKKIVVSDVSPGIYFIEIKKDNEIFTQMLNIEAR